VSVITQPDLEAWVWQNLQTLRGVTCWEFTAIPTNPWQTENGPWVYTHSIQVDCRARRKVAAKQLAEQARQTIVGLLGVPWSDGVITDATATEGPFWLPDDDGAPRYVTRWEITTRPST